jgi:GTPase Era involved in 16S rRNA processing
MLDRIKSMEVISSLKEISAGLNSLYYDEILKLEDMLQENKYKVAVIGEFSSGKSTFLNAIAGKRILYSAAKESTGVVTFLENSPRKTASIFLTSGRVEEVSLSGEDSYEKLKTYLDIKNTEQQVSSVGIDYPLSNIDNEVVFMDTPGLQGISLRQMEITRDILKQSNATIMLITGKGFSQTELELLTGKNPDFGKINTREVFVVVNKIGEIYEGKSEEEALIKLKELEESVREKLRENNLEHIKVFILDSRDYLWSKDNELYNEIKKNNIEKIKKIFNQKEYEERSNFGTFKEYLFKFLEEGSRNAKFLEDINNKILLIIEAFNEVITVTNSSEEKSKEKLLSQLELQKSLLMENRRKLYNTLVRYISNSFEEFSRTIALDVEEVRKSKDKEIADVVQRSFITFRSLNQDNVDLCREEIKKSIEKDRRSFEAKLNEYQEVMYYNLVQKKFNDEFMAVFNTKSNLKLAAAIDRIDIDLKFNEVKFKEDSILEEIKKEINEVEEKINNTNKSITQLKTKNPDYLKKVAEQKKIDAKKDYDREKSKLGIRPDPVQKYRWVTRTRRKWLLFKEEYEEEVPDGLDYSPCTKWDEKNKSLMDSYLSVLDRLDNDLESYREMVEAIWKNENLLQSFFKKKKQLIEEDREARANIEKRRRNSEKLFLDGKKEEIFISLEKFKDKSYERLLEQIDSKIQNMNSQIKEKVKKGLEGSLDQYSSALNCKVSEILQNTSAGSRDSKKTIEKLNRLGEMVL